MKFFAKKIFIVFLSSSIGAGLMLPSAALAVDAGSGGGSPPETVINLAGAETCSNLLGTLGLMPCDPVPSEVPLGVKRDVANKIAWGIAKMLVHKLTEQIVNLIRTGGQGGSPLFVTNWSDFLLDAADQASGVFLKELNLTRLCEPFAPQLRIIFNTGRKSVQERFRCTVSTIAGNLQNFFNDFNNGGWATWIQLTEVQNNPYGAYLGLLEENEKRQGIEVQASLNKALSASGFLPLEECEDQEIEGDIGYGDPETKKVCVAVSPGEWLQNRLAEATNSDIKQLNLADSFNEIIFAAFQTMMQNLFFSPGGLASSNINSDVIKSQLQSDLNSLRQSAISFTGVSGAVSVTESIISKKTDSLAKVKDEIATLNSLKSCQISKQLPTNTTDNSINVATSTKLALETDILEHTLIKEDLLDDRQAILDAQTVDELNEKIAQTQTDVARIGNLSAATTENALITQRKQQAEDDLAACLAPPTPND